MSKPGNGLGYGLASDTELATDLGRCLAFRQGCLGFTKLADYLLSAKSLPVNETTFS